MCNVNLPKVFFFLGFMGKHRFQVKKLWSYPLKGCFLPRASSLTHLTEWYALMHWTAPSHRKIRKFIPQWTVSYFSFTVWPSASPLQNIKICVCIFVTFVMERLGHCKREFIHGGFLGHRNYCVWCGNGGCMSLHFSKPIVSIPPRVNPNGNDGLWVIIMCPCRFSSYNKSTIWRRGQWYRRRRCMCGGRGYVGILSAFCSILLWA